MGMERKRRKESGRAGFYILLAGLGGRARDEVKVRDWHFSGSGNGASSSLDDKARWWRRGEGGTGNHKPLDSTKRSEESNGLANMDE